MKKHIHILGASGSGTTTLAKALCTELNYARFDSDDYFWIKTDPPFTMKRPVEDRRALLKNDLEKAEKWILSGSNCSWGDFLMDYYNLVIFLYVPPQIRMERLVQREIARYGLDRISPGGDLDEAHQVFIKWASEYDEGDMEIRSLALHNEWMKQLKCPVLRIEGDQTIDERVAAALEQIHADEGVIHGL